MLGCEGLMKTQLYFLTLSSRIYLFFFPSAYTKISSGCSHYLFRYSCYPSGILIMLIHYFHVNLKNLFSPVVCFTECFKIHLAKGFIIYPFSLENHHRHIFFLMRRILSHQSSFHENPACSPMRL